MSRFLIKLCIIILLGNVHFTVTNSISVKIKNRIIKTFHCLMGNTDSCSADEVVITRFVAIIVAMELYRRSFKPVWWVEWRRQCAIKNKITIIPNDQKETKCCVCLEEGSQEKPIGEIPCYGERHPAQICKTCLDQTTNKTGICPICRASLA